MKNTLEARTWFRLAAIVCLFLPLVGIAHRAALRAAQGNAVKIVPNGGALEGNPGEKGATYYALESQTTRFTTRFHDGTKAVAERQGMGESRRHWRISPGTRSIGSKSDPTS